MSPGPSGGDARPDPVAGPWDLDGDLIEQVRTAGRAAVAVYPHPGTAAVIGHGGDPWVETRPDVLAADGVPLRRRRGGGCAVVVDPGNLVCSVVLPLPGIAGITRAFAAISGVMAAALAEAGLPGVTQEGTSDLAVGGRKLGGSCIWRTRGILYYSTTVLVDPDLDLIDRYLPHPPREPAYRAGRRHGEFLTTCRREGLNTSAPALAAALTGGLTSRLGDLGAISS